MAMNTVRQLKFQKVLKERKMKIIHNKIKMNQEIQMKV